MCPVRCPAGRSTRGRRRPEFTDPWLSPGAVHWWRGAGTRTPRRLPHRAEAWRGHLGWPRSSKHDERRRPGRGMSRLVAAGAHDPDGRHRPRPPAVRGHRRSPGTKVGDRHVRDPVVTDRLDVRDGLPGHEPAPVAADLDPLWRQPVAGMAAQRGDGEAAQRVGERERRQPPQRNHVEASREHGGGKDQRDEASGQWPSAVAAAEPELDIVHNGIVAPFRERRYLPQRVPRGVRLHSGHDDR
jgi:hypothetical protein